MLAGVVLFARLDSVARSCYNAKRPSVFGCKKVIHEAYDFDCYGNCHANNVSN